MCWALRKGQPGLQKEVENFIARSRRQGLIGILLKALRGNTLQAPEEFIHSYYESFQTGQLPYVNYGADNGLPQEDIFSIFQDRKGYLWFGTNSGAVRYNGREMVVYNHEQGLPGNSVRDIKQDSSGVMYFATTNGIAKLHGDAKVDTLLEGRCTDQRQGEDYLRLIAKENVRLTRLIDNFLTFSRMERNKRAFEFVRADVGEIVADAVEAVRDRFTRPCCRLQVNVAADLSAIDADRDAIMTVLLNLLDNAWKYSGEQKEISVEAYSTNANVCVAVKDKVVDVGKFRYFLGCKLIGFFERCFIGQGSLCLPRSDFVRNDIG